MMMCKTILAVLTLEHFVRVGSKCFVHLKEHGLVNGIGIFAAQDYKANELIEISRGVMLNETIASQTILTDYVSSHVPSFDNVIFGHASLFNHHSSPNVGYQRIEGPQEEGDNTYQYAIFALSDILKGFEMFVSYGTNEWFRQRNIPMHEVKDGDTQSSIYRSLPGCGRSSIVSEGGKLYTLEPISNGTIIETNRALIIPAWKPVGTPIDTLVWYSQGLRPLKGALLILGNGAFYSSPSSGHPLDANVRYAWFNLSNVRANASASAVVGVDGSDADQTALSPTSSCSLVRLVTFTATRNISAGEELTIPIMQLSVPFSLGGSMANDAIRKFTLDEHLPGDCL